MLQAGEALKAAGLLEALVRRHAAHAPAWGALGQARRRAGDAAGAIAALERALTLAPDYADAAFDLGLARQDLGDHAGAAEAFARLPRRAGAQVNLSRKSSLTPRFVIASEAKQSSASEMPTFETRKRWPEVTGQPATVALGSDAGLLRYARNDGIGLVENFCLGGALQEMGRVEEAFAAYGRAYRLDPTTFAPIAHALTSRPHGRLWLSLVQLAKDLAAADSAYRARIARSAGPSAARRRNPGFVQSAGKLMPAA